jgi:two-component system, NtrC family, C4-dicarboxylate transport response regulator DctD
VHHPQADPVVEEAAMERLPQVLVVDDERGIRVALHRILVSAGFGVVAVASGHDALHVISDGQRFDVILTDLEMPGMHGLELIRIVRTRDVQIPIVVLTGHRDAQGTTRLFESGVATCLDKPVAGDVLIQTLRGAIMGQSGNWLVGKRELAKG